MISLKQEKMIEVKKCILGLSMSAENFFDKYVESLIDPTEFRKQAKKMSSLEAYETFMVSYKKHYDEIDFLLTAFNLIGKDLRRAVGYLTIIENLRRVVYDVLTIKQTSVITDPKKKVEQKLFNVKKYLKLVNMTQLSLASFYSLINNYDQNKMLDLIKLLEDIRKVNIKFAITMLEETNSSSRYRLILYRNARKLNGIEKTMTYLCENIIFIQTGKHVVLQSFVGS